MFTTRRTRRPSPSASTIRAATRGSARRVDEYVTPIVSYLVTVELRRVSWLEVEEVAELLLLRAQVGDVLVVRFDAHRHPLDDFEPVRLDAAVLGGVVRHQ